MTKANMIVILMSAIVVVSSIPLVGADIKITWTTYLGIPLIILAGSAGIAFVTKRFEAIIGGVVLAALLPAFWQMACAAAK